MSDQLPPYQQQPQGNSGDDEIQLKDIFRTLAGLLGSWPILLTSMLVGVAIAFAVNRYSEDMYEISAIVAVEEKENPLSSAGSALNFGLSFGGGSGVIQTRQAVVKSYAHNARIARSLGWETKHFIQGRLKRREEYKPDYYTVTWDHNHVQLLGVEMSMEFSEGGFELSREVKGPLSLYSFANGQPVELSITPEFIETLEDAESAAMTYGSWIETPYYRFKIDKGASF